MTQPKEHNPNDETTTVYVVWNLKYNPSIVGVFSTLDKATDYIFRSPLRDYLLVSPFELDGAVAALESEPEPEAPAEWPRVIKIHEAEWKMLIDRPPSSDEESE